MRKSQGHDELAPGGCEVQLCTRSTAGGGAGVKGPSAQLHVVEAYLAGRGPQSCAALSGE